MKRLLPILLLAGCNAPDGYKFEQAEFERGVVTVTVVTHASAHALRKEADRLDVKVEDAKIQAFGFVSPTQPTCTIHIVDPAKSYQPQWMGHELTHCIRGRWHS